MRITKSRFDYRTFIASHPPHLFFDQHTLKRLFSCRKRTRENLIPAASSGSHYSIMHAAIYSSFARAQAMLAVVRPPQSPAQKHTQHGTTRIERKRRKTKNLDTPGTLSRKSWLLEATSCLPATRAPPARFWPMDTHPSVIKISNHVQEHANILRTCLVITPRRLRRT